MLFQVPILLSFLTFHCVSSTNSNIGFRTEANDFLARIIFSISEAKVPEYLVEVIYDRPLEKEITTNHVFDLFQINKLTFNKTQELLNLFNISSSTVFSLDSLNHTLDSLKLDFTSFYNTFTGTVGLTGTPLRNALTALQIDVASFSLGITLGDPDPWTEFKKGNFSEENIQKACMDGGVTIDQLFEALRDIIMSQLKSWKIEDIINLLLRHSIGKNEAVITWNAINITMEHVHSIGHFANILANFSEKINNQTSLGVVTDFGELQINKRTYDLFKTEKKLLDIYAETLVSTTVLTINNMTSTSYTNIVTLIHKTLLGQNLTKIEIGYVSNNLSDCEYVTLQDNVVTTVNVEKAVFVDHTFLIPRNVTNATDIIMGSALVCNNSVYGLAREIAAENIVLDTFSNFREEPLPSGASISKIFKISNMFVLSAYALRVIFN